MADRPFDEEDLLRFARGTAAPELAGRIEEESGRNPELAAEIALMRGLSSALKDEDAGNPPGEFGWRKLERDIRRDQPQQRAANAPRVTQLWRVAAVVFGIAVLGQGAYIASRAPDMPEAVYRTATGAGEEHVLGVVFQPDTSAGEMAEMLRDTGARIIDGPSAIGLYRLTFPTAEALEAARGTFEASGLFALIADA